MNWILLLFALELGYSPLYESLNSTPLGTENIRIENNIYITLETEIKIKNIFFIGGSVKTYFNPMIKSKTFWPFENNYMFKTGLRYKNLEIGFRHLCLHPVKPWESYLQPISSTDGSYEEFYIRISSGF
jgi:hypothetical protein